MQQPGETNALENLIMGSVDFDSEIQLSLQTKEEIKNSQGPWAESAINYRKVEKILVLRGEYNEEEELLLGKAQAAKEKIYRNYQSKLDDIPITFEEDHYSKEPYNWIDRSIKKQLYYFLTNQLPKDFNKRLKRANPLEDIKLQDEIVCRAIGWRYWWKDKKNGPIKWRNDYKVREYFGYRSDFDFPEYRIREMYGKEELTSWALTKLGERIVGLAKL